MSRPKTCAEQIDWFNGIFGDKILKNAWTDPRDAKPFTATLEGWSIKDYETMPPTVMPLKATGTTGESSIADLFHKVTTLPPTQELICVTQRGITARKINSETLAVETRTVKHG